MTMQLDERETAIFVKQGEILAALGVEAPLVFDVGANVGQSIARYRELLPGCRIHSFEPNAQPWETLHRQWSDAPGVTLHQVALANSGGTRELYATRLSELGSLLRPEPWLQALSPGGKYDFENVQVPSATLDDVCFELGIDWIDVLKIDVQGAEREVLEGATGLLQKGAVGAVYLEATLAETYVGQASLRDLLAIMEGHSYVLWDLVPFVYTSVGRAWSGNVLFVCRDWVRKLESSARGMNRSD